MQGREKKGGLNHTLTCCATPIASAAPPPCSPHTSVAWASSTISRKSCLALSAAKPCVNVTGNAGLHRASRKRHFDRFTTLRLGVFEAVLSTQGLLAHVSLAEDLHSAISPCGSADSARSSAVLQRHKMILTTPSKLHAVCLDTHRQVRKVSVHAEQAISDHQAPLPWGCRSQ